ncbi:BrnT family toxin [Acidisoma sp. 7E03]
MTVTFDPLKRDRTLAERGLDFAEAEQLLAGEVLTRRDDRFDYGESRFISAGYLRGRMVVMV